MTFNGFTEAAQDLGHTTNRFTLTLKHGGVYSNAKLVDWNIDVLILETSAKDSHKVYIDIDEVATVELYQ